MRTYHATTSLPADVHRAWQVLSAVVDWPRWLPTVTSVEPLDSAELRPGNRYRIVQPKLRPAVWVVDSLSPPHEFTWSTRSLGLQVTGSHALSPTGPDSTSLVLSIQFKGPLSPLAVAIGGRLTQDYLHREANSLRQELAYRASGKV